jgi:hypothetical protein
MPTLGIARRESSEEYVSQYRIRYATDGREGILSATPANLCKIQLSLERDPHFVDGSDRLCQLVNLGIPATGCAVSICIEGSEFIKRGILRNEASLACCTSICPKDNALSLSVSRDELASRQARVFAGIALLRGCGRGARR